MTYNFNIFLLLIICTTLSCENKKDKLDEINYFSNVKIPYSSSILLYYDDLESDLTFKVKIDRIELDDFLEVNDFKAVDTLKTNSFAKTSTDKYLLNKIKKSFIPEEKIYGENLQILITKKATMVVNYDTYELWGLIHY